MKHLLIADDNHQIVQILQDYAQNLGYQVTPVYDGAAALDAVAEQHFDLILLDVMMPKVNGFDVCRRIRETSNIPIIMITARGEDFERIMGLDLGADDYIVKPFSPGEVMARVRAVLRRLEPLASSGGQSEEKITISDLNLNLTDFTVTIGSLPLALTKKEFEILWYLAQHPNQVFSRDQLLTQLWGYDYYGDTRTVDAHIRRLRAKVEAIPHQSWEITTVWGIGYKLEVSV